MSCGSYLRNTTGINPYCSGYSAIELVQPYRAYYALRIINTGTMRQRRRALGYNEFNEFPATVKTRNANPTKLCLGRVYLYRSIQI